MLSDDHLLAGRKRRFTATARRRQGDEELGEDPGGGAGRLAGNLVLSRDHLQAGRKRCLRATVRRRQLNEELAKILEGESWPAGG